MTDVSKPRQFENETGYWEIWIDDLDGELAMMKCEQAAALIPVVEYEVFQLALKELEEERARSKRLANNNKNLWAALDKIREADTVDGKAFSIAQMAIDAMGEYGGDRGQV